MGFMSAVNCDNAKSMPTWHAFCIIVKQRLNHKGKAKTTGSIFVIAKEGGKNHVEYNHRCSGSDVVVGHGHFIYRRGAAAYPAGHCRDRVLEQFL